MRRNIATDAAAINRWCKKQFWLFPSRCSTPCMAIDATQAFSIINSNVCTSVSWDEKTIYGPNAHTIQVNKSNWTSEQLEVHFYCFKYIHWNIHHHLTTANFQLNRTHWPYEERWKKLHGEMKRGEWTTSKTMANGKRILVHEHTFNLWWRINNNAIQQKCTMR